MGVDAKTTMGAPSRSELAPPIGFGNRPEATHPTEGSINKQVLTIGFLSRTEGVLSASGTTPEARSLTGLTERKQKAEYTVDTTHSAPGEPTTQPGAFRVKPGVTPMPVIPAAQDGSVLDSPHQHSVLPATPRRVDDTDDVILPATLVLAIDYNDRSLSSGELNIPRATEIDAAETGQFVRTRRAAVLVAVVAAVMLAVLLACILFKKEIHQLNPSNKHISIKEFASLSWPADAPDPGSPQGLALSWLAGDIRDATMIAWKMRQRYTLAVLYFSLNGKWWLNNADWLSSHHECLWYSDGQQCDSKDRWIILSMTRNNISGTLPQDLGYLSHLEQISLENNVIWGRIPKEVASLARLEVLSLAENAFSGSMPTEIGMLQSLEYLQLSYNRLSGQIPTAIGRLTNLRSLDMSHNAFTGTVGFLSSGAEKSRLTNAPELGFLPNLSDLFLRKNMLTGTIPHEISRLANLRQVDFSGNAFTGPIPSELYEYDLFVCDNDHVRWLVKNRLHGVPSFPGFFHFLIQGGSFAVESRSFVRHLADEICSRKRKSEVAIRPGLCSCVFCGEN
jgi:Leucine rich repeat